MGGFKEFKILHICFFLTFFLMGLGTNLVQVAEVILATLSTFLQAILSLLLPRRLFHRANYYTVAGIYGYLVCLADWFV